MVISRWSICICQVLDPHVYPHDNVTKARREIKQKLISIEQSQQTHQGIIADQELTPFTGKPCNNLMSFQHTSNVCREKVGHMTVKHKYCNIFQKDNCLQYKIYPAIR